MRMFEYWILRFTQVLNIICCTFRMWWVQIFLINYFAFKISMIIQSKMTEKEFLYVHNEHISSCVNNHLYSIHIHSVRDFFFLNLCPIVLECWGVWSVNAFKLPGHCSIWSRNASTCSRCLCFPMETAGTSFCLPGWPWC